jgi:hypothetical protein
MSEETSTALPITDPYKTPTVFVNQVAGAGHLNGVVNITFTTAQFTPNSDGQVLPDLVITARLRMDLFCAQQLYAELGRIIAQNIKDSGETAN